MKFTRNDFVHCTTFALLISVIALATLAVDKLITDRLRTAKRPTPVPCEYNQKTCASYTHLRERYDALQGQHTRLRGAYNEVRDAYTELQDRYIEVRLQCIELEEANNLFRRAQQGEYCPVVEEIIDSFQEFTHGFLLGMAEAQVDQQEKHQIIGEELGKLIRNGLDAAKDLAASTKPAL